MRSLFIAMLDCHVEYESSREILG